MYESVKATYEKKYNLRSRIMFKTIYMSKQDPNGCENNQDLSDGLVNLFI